MRLQDRAFILLQYLLPQHALTALIYALARIQTRWIKNALIRGFMRLFTVDLSEALITQIDDYKTFNDFFTRALKPTARPIPNDAHSIASPADGTVSECGAIHGQTILQAQLTAKKRTYTLSELLGDDAKALHFIDGSFATIYLAPHNYHRVHVPFAGTLTGIKHIPGRLFSVNRVTAMTVPQLFARNERIICHFTTTAGACAIVFVGALNVGSISIDGCGQITPTRHRKPRAIDLPTNRSLSFALGEQLGHFNMGSTVIVLMPHGQSRFDPHVVAGTNVRMGERIGTLPQTTASDASGAFFMRS